MAKVLKMPSVMAPQHQFSMVPKATIERSVFDRSHGYKTTFYAGYLVPFYLDEVLPGDTFHLQAHLLCRLSTPIKPVMDNMYVETFFFFVPYRLIWSNFVKFMGEQEPSTFTVYTIPQSTPPAAGYGIGLLEDYFGIPTGIPCAGTWTHSALPTRAYQLIYNQWFRDENLIPSITVPLGDGPDAVGGTGTFLRRRGKRHDYFTSCLPWTQKSSGNVAMPIGGTAPVYVSSDLTAIGVGVTGSTSTPSFLNNAGVNNIQRSGTGGGIMLTADLAAATANGGTINGLRQAFQIQKFLERDARGGTRYTEKVKAHFGVTSPDARLQRAEYLGGGSTPMNVQPVPQMAPLAVGSAAPNNTVIGTLSGYATAFAGGHGFAKSFTEHGLIMGLVNVRADLTYSQGLERMWSRSTIYDLYWPEFAHLGEQAVLNKEIYLADNATQNNAAFGYQERYAEYRYKPSRVTGLFRPYVAGTLAVWNLSENFGALPTLGQTFIEDQTSTILDRVLAVNTEPDIIMDSYIQLKCARPMPVYGVPGLIDHF